MITSRVKSKAYPHLQSEFSGKLALHLGIVETLKDIPAGCTFKHGALELPIHAHS